MQLFTLRKQNVHITLLLQNEKAYCKKSLFSVNENQESFEYIHEQILETVKSKKIYKGDMLLKHYF